jgi:ABC-type nitrate/sulfonate/bicarbonate transport system substrate-binding protein
MGVRGRERAPVWVPGGLLPSIRAAPLVGPEVTRKGLTVREPQGTTGEDAIGALSRRSFIGRGAATFAATGVSGALLAACGSSDDKSSSSSSSGGSTTAKKVTDVTFIDILPPNMGNFAEMLAEVRGYFKDEGIKVKVEVARGSAPAIQSLIAGKALITAVGLMENCLHISNEGAPMVLVSNAQKVSPLAFVSSTKTPINAPNDFRGKTVGVPSKGGTSELSLNVMLAKAKIPISEVKRQVTGISPGTFELVRKGRIAGFTVSGQDEARFKNAIPDVNWMVESKFVADGYGYFVTSDALKTSRPAIEAYLKAVQRATKDVIADKANGYTKTLTDLRAHYDFDGLKDDKVAKPALDYLLKVRLSEGEENLMIAKPEDMKKVYDQLVPIKAVKTGQDPTKWVDGSLLSAS